MRIRCSSLRDFMENLESARVYRGTVHFERSRNPIGDNPRNATSFEIAYFVSAVLLFDPTGEAICECAELCGLDRVTADRDDSGSKRLDVLHARLQKFCKEHDLKMLPGILDR